MERLENQILSWSSRKPQWKSDDLRVPGAARLQEATGAGQDLSSAAKLLWPRPAHLQAMPPYRGAFHR